jgi:thymidylate synthase
MNKYSSVNEAYHSSLQILTETGRSIKSVIDGNSVGSLFGEKEREFIELLGVSFVLTNPRNRLIYSENRKVSFGFNVANYLWLMSGRNDVETISFYNKKGAAYSGNGTYYEAAFGDRIFGNSQLWNFANNLLIKDETTRRALLPIFFPDDLKNLPNDTPCASSIQLMVRNNKLEFFLHMRSQSVAMVFPYDIFLFTMLHEYMATCLSVELGNFYYYCNSFHFYKDEQSIVENIIKEEYKEAQAMEKMDMSTPKMMNDLITLEKHLRESILKKSLYYDELLSNLSPYWKRLFEPLILKACKEHDVDVELKSSYLTNKHLFV